MKFIRNIWCMRTEHRYFCISKILDHGATSWYVILFGKEYWFGPNKPEFVGKERKR
jgi:hypothetical protein